MVDGFLVAAVVTIPLILVLFMFSKLAKTPAEEKHDRTDDLCRINYPKLGILTLSLPLSAFILTILISILKNLEGTTKTHCNVVNILPSISASIGDFTPQRYIWRLAIGLHSAPRLLYAYTHYTWLCLTSRKAIVDNATFQIFCQIGVWCDLLEIFALLGLTVVSSTEYFAFHEGCTVLFLVMALIYMTIVNLLFNWRLARYRDRQFSTSYKIKKTCWFMTLISVVMMAYLYWRHNKYCEPYIYSGFAFFEYVVVIATICFHGSAALDLQDKQLIVNTEKSRFVQHV
ncbi:post-GPI attachment to proteins factor 2-like [Ptychodera flava]|uniref:post-GPI attachment to proteins factor 2-like n=1 Tax=Ptychodera flava TaxID=63121 RepID=UPI00396A57AD